MTSDDISIDIMLEFQQVGTLFQLDIVVVEDIFPVMVKDALVTSHPVSPKLNHPDEIAESFDQISYNKVFCYCKSIHFNLVLFS